MSHNISNKALYNELQEICQNCTRIIYVLTEAGVPKLSAREMTLTYRQKCDELAKVIPWREFILGTTYAWALDVVDKRVGQSSSTESSRWWQW